MSAAVPAEEPGAAGGARELADQDPLIDARTDTDGRSGSRSTAGCSRRCSVDAGRGARDRGRFADAAVLHVERPRTRGEAVIRLNTDENPHQATIGLRIEPGPTGLGAALRRPRPPASDMPLYLFGSAEAVRAAVEKHVAAGAGARPSRLGGDRLPRHPDRVRVQHVDGPPSRRGPTSTAYDYRQVTPRVVRRGARAGREPSCASRCCASSWRCRPGTRRPCNGCWADGVPS